MYDANTGGADRQGSAQRPGGPGLTWASYQGGRGWVEELRIRPGKRPLD